MITIFNRRKLLVDISQRECNRVRMLLKENGIEYHCVTSVTDDGLSRLSNMKAGMDLNQSYSSQSNYIYYIYVHRKDYQKAKRIAFQT